MLKYAALGLLLLGLAGCAGQILPVTVYGHSGAAFTAPNLCQALTQCLNSKEKSCFYERQSSYATETGVTINFDTCKEVKK